MKKTISLVLVLALGLAAEVANADFTFGTSKNLGPTVNSSANDGSMSISANGLELYFGSYNRPGGYGHYDIWVAKRETIDDDWSSPTNLGPTINSSSREVGPEISADGLTLYFNSDRPGGYGDVDLWLSTRPTTNDPWAEPVNLGPTINSSYANVTPNVSGDGLELFFTSDRPGGSGGQDIWITERQTTRQMTELVWGTPVNLGPTINSSNIEGAPEISADGLALFFNSDRPGGYGGTDLWVATRVNVSDLWGTTKNLGPMVNSLSGDSGAALAGDGSTLYFTSDRPGGFGSRDLYQAPIIPIVDFNGDGIVDSADMCIMVDHWDTNEPLCDIGPMPWGDGIVDVQDLIVLAEHFEKITPNEEINVDEDDADGQVELEQGQILVVTLESNPTTGYRWEVVETQESILEQMGEAEFKPSETGGPPMVGAGGWEIFRFKAISVGQMTLQLVYHRPWEEGVEPLKTFSLQVVVR